METITCDLADLGGVLEAEGDRMLEDYRERLGEAVSLVERRMEQQVPRQTGDLAASIQPYVGEPGATWSRGGGGRDTGDAEVKSALQEWQPGEEVGVATDAPYGRKIIMNAGDQTGRKYRERRKARVTYTKKVAAGWVDVIVADANRLLEGYDEG